jgi:hypothetical protein
MSVDSNQLLDLWRLEDVPVCDEGMRVAQAFLEAVSECVNTLVRGS